MKPWAAAPLLLAAVSGCGGDRSWFPLDDGHEWSYSVRGSLAEFVEPVKVLRRLPVAGVDGFELGGPLGTCRVAWKGNTLYATALAGLSVAEGSPPLPLLVGDGADRRLDWKGKLLVAGKGVQASASLEQKPVNLSLPGRQYATLHTKLTVRTPEATVEVLTWYAEGIGPLRQEQRTNGAWDVGLEYLGGP